MNDKTYDVKLFGGINYYEDFTVHSKIVLEMHTSHFLYPIFFITSPDDGFWVINK